jgi:putative membrane protein
LAGIVSPTNPCGAFQIASNINAITGGTGAALAGPIKGGLSGGLTALGCTVAADGTTVDCPGNPAATGALTASLAGIYGPGGVAQQLGVANLLGTNLLPKLTSDPGGQPDLSTANGNTATGILNELRAALALGGVGSSGVPGKCAGYVVPGEPSSGPNPRATPEQIAATCSAADVLNISSLALGAVSTGVSSTLLQSISDQLVAGVQPLADGVDDLAAGTSQLLDGVIPLAAGTSELAAGLPAAVDGANTIRTDAAGGLIDAGNAAAKGFGRQVALYDAMNNPELVASYVPGGAPTGDNVTTNAAFVYELAGTGSGGTNTTANLAIGLLALAGAGGLGYALTRRAKAG